MSHDTPLITMLALAFVIAFAFGMIAQKFRLSPWSDTCWPESWSGRTLPAMSPIRCWLSSWPRSA